MKMGQNEDGDANLYQRMIEIHINSTDESYAYDRLGRLSGVSVNKLNGNPLVKEKTTGPQLVDFHPLLLKFFSCRDDLAWPPGG